MAQAHKGTVARPGANSRQLIGGANAILALVAAGVSVALILPSLAPQAVEPASLTSAREAITDGWRPAAAAAQSDRLERVQDGYLSGLLPAGSDPRDGWER